MNIKPFKALYPVFERITSPDAFCDDAKNAFQTYLEEGLYAGMPAEAMYVYQIQTETGKHTGLIAMNDVEDFFAGKIKKHENTISEKEEQQLQLFLRWKAVLKPILLTYDPVEAIDQWLAHFTRSTHPLLSARFEKDGQKHRLWALNDPQKIAGLQALFQQHVNRTYIADGHHRVTATVSLHERFKNDAEALPFKQFFCAFFSSDQLDILDFNRVVDISHDASPTRLMAQLSKLFDIDLLDAPQKPTQKHEIVMCLRREWYRLRWKTELLRQYPLDHVTLDAVLLNEHVLRDLLHIADVRNDARISYVEGSKGLKGLQKAIRGGSEKRVGFMLFPVTMDDMMHITDAGDTLPPKSTYFEPRMRSGILVNAWQ